MRTTFIPAAKPFAATQELFRLGGEMAHVTTPFVASGEHMAPPNRIASDKIIREGDLVFIDIGAMWSGYFGDLGRTVICACEKVTALEIHDALRCAIPAKSIAGVAKRTRATWGRCQGAACLSGVSFITSLYLEAAAWQIPWGEPSATIGVAEARRG